MSARREKRLRSLERRVQKLEVMASAGFLESNLREELAKVNNRPENAWWCRTCLLYTSLAISHDPTMKARFVQNIVVTGGEDGSTVTME